MDRTIVKTYTANVTRDGKWWMVSIPELDGLTQARRLGEAELMAREFIAVTIGTRLTDIAVEMTIDIGDLHDAGRRAAEIRHEREEAARLEAHAIAASKELAQELAARDVPVRDIGELLGVTFQRASQLVNS